MEGVPAGSDLAALARSVKDLPEVLDVHDLHVWTIASGLAACSLRVVVAEPTVRSGRQVLRAVAGMVRERFGVAHPTIPIEVEGCAADALLCTMIPAAGRPGGRGQGPSDLDDCARSDHDA